MLKEGEKRSECVVKDLCCFVPGAGEVGVGAFYVHVGCVSFDIRAWLSTERAAF